jgi:hypothetical protein
VRGLRPKDAAGVHEGLPGHDPALCKRRVWLFDGAAVSAFFALVLVIISVVSMQHCPGLMPRPAS